MSGMFAHAGALNQPLSFNTARVTDMDEMFAYAQSVISGRAQIKNGVHTKEKKTRMDARAAIDSALETMLAGVNRAVDDAKDELKIWIQRDMRITPVYRQIICEGIDGIPTTELVVPLVRGDTGGAKECLLEMPVVYPRITYRFRDGGHYVDWSTEFRLSIPLRSILMRESWDVGTQEKQWVRADGTSGLHEAVVFSDDDDSEIESRSEPEESRELVEAINPAAVARGVLFESLRRTGIRLEEPVVFGTVLGKRVAWTDLEWSTATASGLLRDEDYEMDEPDGYEVVDLAGPRKLPHGLRGLHEKSIVREWGMLAEVPAVAAQIAYIKHIQASSANGGFESELKRWPHPLIHP